MTRAWHNDETTEFLFTDVSGLTPHVLPGAPLSCPHLCSHIPSCDLPVADPSPIAGEPDTRRHKSCKLRAVGEGDVPAGGDAAWWYRRRRYGPELGGQR